MNKRIPRKKGSGNDDKGYKKPPEIRWFVVVGRRSPKIVEAGYHGAIWVASVVRIPLKFGLDTLFSAGKAGPASTFEEWNIVFLRTGVTQDVV